MAYEPHIKLTMSGTFDNGSGGAAVEIFSMSMAFANLGGALPSAAQLEALIGPVASGCEQWFSAAATGIAVNCTLTQVKLAPIAATGKYLGDAALETMSTNGGVNNDGPFPSEVSYAISLRTAVRGPKGRGRFYVPGPTLPVTGGWRIDPTAVQSAANEAEAQFFNVATAGSVAKAFTTGSPDPDDPYNLVVASKVAGNVLVTTVEVGDVYDTIRRRRNKLRENYHVGTG